MLRKLSKISLAVVLAGGSILASGAATTAAAAPVTKAAKHATKTKHSKKFLGFHSGVSCDGNGGAGMSYSFCGIVFFRGDSVPNSSLCD